MAQRFWVLVTGRPADAEPSPDGKKLKKAHVAEIALSDKFLLNRKDRFTLRVVLSGEPAPKRKRIEYLGKFAGGKVVPEPPRLGPGNRRMFFGAITTLALAGLLVGLFVGPQTGPGPSSCAGGALQLEGSTAFGPTAQLIANQYKTTCPGAHLTVGNPAAVTGSVSGLNALISSGPAQAGSQIAMSDGPAPAGSHYASLSGTAVGVISFAVVVNRNTGVYNLTSREISQIFSGAITSWSQIPGGVDLPVSIVSRDPGSGTRRAFDQYVLGGSTEPGASSFDCTDKDLTKNAKVTLCEEPSTGALLQEVAQVPGAIGYAETSAADVYPGHAVQTVELNGVQDAFGQLGTRPGSYQFWTVEYLYTYGSPPAKSLAGAFLGYLGNGTVKNLLSGQEITPCAGRQQGIAALCTPGAR
jgi:ABC-type phosphate transport system substrate-binding protein